MGCLGWVAGGHVGLYFVLVLQNLFKAVFEAYPHCARPDWLFFFGFYISWPTAHSHRWAPLPCCGVFSLILSDPLRVRTARPPAGTTLGWVVPLLPQLCFAVGKISFWNKWGFFFYPPWLWKPVQNWFKLDPFWTEPHQRSFSWRLLSVKGPVWV